MQSNLPDALAQALMPALKLHEIVRKTTVYRARIGRRRAYQSETDALAYEAGYRSWERGDVLAQPHTSPFADGFMDAEAEDESRFWAQVDARYEEDEE